MKHDIANISTYVSKNKALDGVAFYESIPLFGKDQWQNNKHLFISSLDRESIRSIDKFYSLAHIINKQQDLITNLQNNHFFLVQKSFADVESSIVLGLALSMPADSRAGLGSHAPLAQQLFSERKAMVESIIGNGQLTSYTPVQAVETLDKALQKCIPARKADMLGFNRKALKIGKAQ